MDPKDPKDPRSRLVARAAALKEGFADEDPTSKGLMLWLVLEQLERVLGKLDAVGKQQGEPVALSPKMQQMLERILFMVGGSVELKGEKTSLTEMLGRIEDELGTASSGGSAMPTGSGLSARLADMHRELTGLRTALGEMAPKVTQLVARSTSGADDRTRVPGAALRLRRTVWLGRLGFAVCGLGLILAVLVGVVELKHIDRQQPVVGTTDPTLAADVRQAAAASTQAVAALEHLQAMTKVVCKRWGPAVDAAGKLVTDPETGRPRYEGQDCESVIIPASQSNPGPQPSR